MKIHILNIIIIANFFFILYRSQHLLSNRKEPRLYCHQIHISEVKKILEKKETYVASNLDEIAECINKWTDKRRKGGEIDRHYLQNLIYGKEMEAEDYKTCALGKFKHDILEYYKVYK